jgi:hypothetical protein
MNTKQELIIRRARKEAHLEISAHLLAALITAGADEHHGADLPGKAWELASYLLRLADQYYKEPEK